MSRRPQSDLPYYDALILYGQSIVDPGAGSAPNVAALANPHGLPMEIYEIRHQIYPLNSVDASFNFLTGMSIGAKFDLGAIAITDGKVPLDGFGNTRDDADIATPSLSINTQGDAVTANPVAYSWRLKYPLLVPSGAVLTPTYEHLGQNPFQVVVETLYFARTLPPNYSAPDRIKVPWVSAFNSNSYDNVGDTAKQQQLSSELDLVNNFDGPLEISRLNGRCSAVVAVSPFDFANARDTAMEWQGDHRFRLMNVRIRGSRGDEIARVATPFNGLWPVSWRSWDIPGGWIMRPGEFYKVQLSVNSVDYVPRTQDIGRVQVAVTAVGYREIDTRVAIQAALQPVPEVTP